MCFPCSISLNLQHQLPILTIHAAKECEVIWGRERGMAGALICRVCQFPAVQAMPLSRAGKRCSPWTLLTYRKRAAHLKRSLALPRKAPVSASYMKGLLPMNNANVSRSTTYGPSGHSYRQTSDVYLWCKQPACFSMDLKQEQQQKPQKLKLSILVLFLQIALPISLWNIVHGYPCIR